MNSNFIESSYQIVWKKNPKSMHLLKNQITWWAGNYVPKCNPISDFDEST
jgi:hypothetical protein